MGWFCGAMGFAKPGLAPTALQLAFWKDDCKRFRKVKVQEVKKGLRAGDDWDALEVVRTACMKAGSLFGAVRGLGRLAEIQKRVLRGWF